MQIEEEGEPGSGLVLGEGGNDGDVNLGVTRVPERVKSTAPRGNVAGVGEKHDAQKDETSNGGDGSYEERLQLRLREEALDILEESVRLKKNENARRCHVLASTNRLKADKGNLH